MRLEKANNTFAGCISPAPFTVPDVLVLADAAGAGERSKLAGFALLV